VHAELPSVEPLLGTADIQSLADLGNSYSLLRDMRHRDGFALRRYRVNYNGTFGVAVKAPGAFGIEVYLAKNEAHYEHLLSDYEIPADAPYLFDLPG
jgi:hypothetical protein